ncbi:MAG: hypothetical protein QGG42_02570 [Phycisphaerae bacterium]|nr:hypothetical protein [Phycisphaerae bacterium]
MTDAPVRRRRRQKLVNNTDSTLADKLDRKLIEPAGQQVDESHDAQSAQSDAIELCDSENDTKSSDAYPTGQQLVYDILNIIRGRADFLQNELQIPFQSLDTFAAALSTCGLSSIDEFLEHQTDLIELGRILIALCLMPKEQPDVLWAQSTDKENWYKEHLFPAMKTQSLEDFGKNELSVITYNYDRSLEHFLFQSLFSTYSTNDDDAPCWRQLEEIPIVHLHGQLDNLYERPYSDTSDPTAIKQSAAKIRIIHEDIASDPQFTQAHDLLREAKRVYFLGFGYNQVNLDRLHFKDIPISPSNVLGTMLGFGRIAQQNLKTRTLNRIGLFHCNIMEFFRQYAALA